MLFFKRHKARERVIKAALAYIQARHNMAMAKRTMGNYDEFESLFGKADIAFDELVEATFELNLLEKPEFPLELGVPHD